MDGRYRYINREMNRLLRQTISYHDYREDFYHAFLAGIFAGAGYMVESNREHGEGRSDIVISDLTNSKIIILKRNMQICEYNGSGLRKGIGANQYAYVCGRI